MARHRWLYLGLLIMTVAMLYLLLLTPHGLQFFNDRPRPAPHLFVTICIWLLSVAYIELRPLAKSDAPVSERA